MPGDLTIEMADDEPSGLAHREQEAADRSSQSPGGVKIETASREHIDSWLASLPTEKPHSITDGVRLKPANRRPHSAPATLVHTPHPLAHRSHHSHPVDASQLAEALPSLGLPTPSLAFPTPSLSRPTNFFPLLNSPDSPWPHGSSITLVGFEQATPAATSPSEMYHFPQPADFQATHQWRMAEFHARSLSQILEPAAIPIGTDAGLRVRPYNSVVLVENIPYTVTRHEVAQFFGRNARLADGFPIHIIMERPTGKTMDCYVEFASAKDAEAAVDRVKKLHDASQGPRMSNRYVDVSLSSQDALMKTLFPRAKCIKWEGGRPVEVPKHPQEQDLSGFVGFMTDEELFCVGRHAREPHRSSYANKVPQRTYESIISTIWKFPWHATDMYTVWARNQIYKTLLAMVEVLAGCLRNSRTVGLDARLLSELVRAGLECPAFNPRMKYRLAYISGDQDILGRMQKDWLRLFPFDSLTWLRPNDSTALEFYGMLIAKGHATSLPAGLELSPEGLPDSPYLYGRWWFLWGHEESKGIMFRDAINAEMKVLRDLLISGFHAMQAERQAMAAMSANIHPPAMAWANTQPGGVPLMGSSQLQQSDQAHWPSQGPYPVVPGAVAPAPAGPSVPPRPPVPRRLGSPAQIVPRRTWSLFPSSSTSAPRRGPGPRGPHDPFGPGNWRGNSSGPSGR